MSAPQITAAEEDATVLSPIGIATSGLPQCYRQWALLPNGKFPLKEADLAAMDELRAACEAFGVSLANITKRYPEHDRGTMIRSFQKVQEIKDTACCAFIVTRAPAE